MIAKHVGRRIAWKIIQDKFSIWKIDFTIIKEVNEYTPHAIMEQRLLVVHSTYLYITLQELPYTKENLEVLEPFYL